MNTSYSPLNRNQRPSLFRTLLGFMLLMTVGGILQAIPIYTVVFQLCFPFIQEVSELLVAGSLSTDQAAFLIQEKILLLSDHPLMLVATLVGTGAIIGVFAFWVGVIQKKSISFLGIRKEKAVRNYLIGMGIGFLMFAVAVGICLISGAAKIEFNSFRWSYILLFFFGFMIQGLEEEILMRGYLLGSFKGTMPRFQAVFLSSILFSLLHMENEGVSVLALINIVLFGIFAGYYFIRTNSIWGVAAIHTVWNFAQGNIFGCSVSGLTAYDSIFKTILTEGRDSTHGGVFGPEGGLAVTIVLVTALFILIWTALPSSPKRKK